MHYISAPISNEIQNEITVGQAVLNCTPQEYETVNGYTVCEDGKPKWIEWEG